MPHLGDHAAGRGRIGQLRYPIDPVEPEPDQGLALVVLAAGRARDPPPPHVFFTGHVVFSAPLLLRPPPRLPVPAAGLPGGGLPVSPGRRPARAARPPSP